MLYIIITALIIGVDQVVKYLVRSNMVPGDSISVIGDFFQIEYVVNKGAAFGILSGNHRLLILIPVVVIVISVCLLFSKKDIGRFAKISVVMIMAGGAGNLIDRAMAGQVTDMFAFSIFPPVFNVADIAVTVGAFFLIIDVLFGEAIREKARRKRR